MSKVGPLGFARISAALIMTLVFLQPATILAAPGAVLGSFAAPGESPGDLTWDGAHLWLLDDQTGIIYQLDHETGLVLREVTPEIAEPCGLTSDGTGLWVSDQAQRALLQLDLDGAATGISVPAPGTSRGPSASRLGGLAWDGTNLWTGTIAGWSSQIRQCDAATGEVTRGHFSIGYPIALETDGRRLWSATTSVGGDPGKIFQYDFDAGTYISHFDAPGQQPVGLACDGTTLWCVDADLRRIFQLTLD